MTWELQRDDLSRWSIMAAGRGLQCGARAFAEVVKLVGTRTQRVSRAGRRERAEPAGYTQAEAERLAQIYLAGHASALAGLRLEVDAYCRTPDGARRPIWHVRAGDVIRLRDLIPDQDVTIRVAETRSSSGGMEIVPAGADDRLETILAAQEQSLRSEV